jgi:hypothetical protein
MSKKFLVNIDMNNNQILNLVIQQLGSDPGSPVEGQIWYNTTSKQVKYRTNAATIILYEAVSTNTNSKVVLRDVSGNFSANVGTFNSVTISNTPSAASDAATKSYVDNVVQGLNPKGTARLATNAALPSNTYSNGSSGVGATLTATGNGALSVDSVAVAVGDVILVKDEATASRNGLYVVTATGGAGAPYVLTRSSNFDIATEIAGGYVFVTAEGTNYDNTGWLVSSVGPYTIGTTDITFTQFTGAGSLSATAPVVKTGNAFSLSYTARLVNNGGSLDLASSVISTPGSYALVTVDTYGRVTAGADIVSGNGIVAKTTTGTYTNRSVAGTAGRITVSNGDGVSGNPTIDLVSGIATASTYYGQLTVDTYGRVTAGADLVGSNGIRGSRRLQAHSRIEPFLRALVSPSRTATVLLETRVSPSIHRWWLASTTRPLSATVRRRPSLSPITWRPQQFMYE